VISHVLVGLKGWLVLAFQNARNLRGQATDRLTLRIHQMPTLLQATTGKRLHLVDMMKVNTSINKIHLGGHYTEHELFRGPIVPYLKTNRFRPCVRAIQKARPIAYRAKVLGQALVAVRSDPNRFWMILSGNAEIAFPSTTANLRTPATTATAPSNAAAVAASTGAAATVTQSISATYQFLCCRSCR
jgi:hypothetical protein